MQDAFTKAEQEKQAKASHDLSTAGIQQTKDTDGTAAIAGPYRFLRGTETPVILKRNDAFHESAETGQPETPNV